MRLNPALELWRLLWIIPKERQSQGRGDNGSRGGQRAAGGKSENVAGFKVSMGL